MVDKAIVLHNILIPSICILYKEDFNNIRFDVSERNICARLAHVHDTLLGAFIIYSKDGVDMDIFEFSSKEGNVIPRKYSLRCLFREYDETKINAIEINDGTQSWLIDPKVPHKK